MNDMENKAYVFGMIFLLSNKLQILGDKMDPCLTVKQWFFLAGVLRCESNTPTLSELGAKIGSSRQNVKKIASLLEKQGFVLMEKDPEDGRVVRINLTDACVEYLKQREEMEDRFIEELFENFRPEDISLLSEMFQSLEGNVNEMGLKYDERKA
ncbi:MarR family winged helix-turn-helix transcriptional regulator [Lacrimispora indolis]|uniref:MarR family winged helix-turn-helix transcriptional regulator n=1 Tax=Lacrimispora indolis TaxID=69825 RepID=UPI000422CA5A|nr:MarR family transcriptional regulator [[Clostridium] methoxybenzovorans]